MKKIEKERRSTERIGYNGTKASLNLAAAPPVSEERANGTKCNE